MFEVFEINFKRQRTNISLVLFTLYLLVLGKNLNIFTIKFNIKTRCGLEWKV